LLELQLGSIHSRTDVYADEISGPLVSAYFF